MSDRALVLGGGGSVGNAWEIGVIAGPFDAGLDVTEADLLIATSAGSIAAAPISSASPAQLLAAIVTAVLMHQPVWSSPTLDSRPERRSLTTWKERTESSASPRVRPTCAAE